MLNEQTRELLVKAYEKSHNAEEVARNYSVNVSTVYRLAKQKRETNSLALKVSQRGRKPTLTEENKKEIAKLIDEQCDITIDEIISKLNLTVCNEVVRKAVIKMGYTYKKKSFHSAERHRLRCGRKAQGMD